MKTIFYRLLGLAMLLSFSMQGICQDVLRYGKTPNNSVVELPIFYWDLLHNSSEGWTWQYYNANNPAQPWNNYQQSVNLKNSNGRFTEVTTLDWNATTKTWNNYLKNTFKYIEDTAGLPLEITWEKQSASVNGGAKFENTFEQGKIKEMIISFSSGGVFIPVTQSIILYNSEGNRTTDSGISIQSGTPNYKSLYEYDNQHRCTKELYFGLNFNAVLELQNYSTYTYTATGKIESAHIFNVISGQGDNEAAAYDFTYTPAGNIENAITYAPNTGTGLMEPDGKYIHYYNAQGRLSAMSYRGYVSLGEWATVDSFAFNYLPNGGYDTSYIYFGQGANAWQTTPSQRLVFVQQTNTGTNTPVTVKNKIQVYPNPAKEKLYVKFEGANDGIATIVITDIAGHSVINQTAEVVAGQATKAEVSLNNLATGIYMLHTGGQTQKIIVE